MQPGGPSNNPHHLAPPSSPIQLSHLSPKHPKPPTNKRMLCRLWRTWVLAAGLYGAVTAGAAGLRAGAKLGRTLVEEQSGAVVHILAALADVLGTPAVGALACVLASCCGGGSVRQGGRQGNGRDACSGGRQGSAEGAYKAMLGLRPRPSCASSAWCARHAALCAFASTRSKKF